jgi:hypothetical protein
MLGGSGFDGSVPTDAPDEAGWWFARILGSDVANVGGYALVSSDSGHQARAANLMEDFSWVVNNPTALRNHAYKANHAVLWAAVDLAPQLYGKVPAHRYIVGGSNGGRAGLVAIQNYPTDYDGVLSFEPAIKAMQLVISSNRLQSAFKDINDQFKAWFDHNDRRNKYFSQSSVTEAVEMETLQDFSGAQAATGHDSIPSFARTMISPIIGERPHLA